MDNSDTECESKNREISILPNNINTLSEGCEFRCDNLMMRKSMRKVYNIISCYTKLCQYGHISGGIIVECNNF